MGLIYFYFLVSGRYDVLFHDGFLKSGLPGIKIAKIDSENIRNDIKNFTDIGTKEERRERKRKINVAELFHINKRSKKKGKLEMNKLYCLRIGSFWFLAVLLCLINVTCFRFSVLMCFD